MRWSRMARHLSHRPWSLLTGPLGDFFIPHCLPVTCIPVPVQEVYYLGELYLVVIKLYRSHRGHVRTGSAQKSLTVRYYLSVNVDIFLLETI